MVLHFRSLPVDRLLASSSSFAISKNALQPMIAQFYKLSLIRLQLQYPTHNFSPKYQEVRRKRKEQKIALRTYNGTCPQYTMSIKPPKSLPSFQMRAQKGMGGKSVVSKNCS